MEIQRTMFEKHLNTSIFNREELEINISTQIVVLIAIFLAVTFPETKAWVCLICRDCRVGVQIIQIRSYVQKRIKLMTFFNLPRFWNLKITNVVLVFARDISIQNADLTLCVVFCKYLINNSIIRGDNAIGLIVGFCNSDKISYSILFKTSSELSE